MDAVTHNGITYKKATALAKEFKYTTDYIGQLCRAKKVDARLVGRAWYVNPDSLTGHKKNRYQVNSSAEESLPVEIHKVSSTGDKQSVKRVAIEPVLTSKTVRILKHFETTARQVAVTYQPDDGSLMPRVTKAESKLTVGDTTKNATDIPVKIEKTSIKPTILKPEPLPTVYLRGKLPVSAIAEKATLSVTEADMAEHVVQSVHLGSEAQKMQRQLPQRNHHDRSTMRNITRDNDVNHSHIGKVETQQSPNTTHPEVQRFSPQSVATVSRTTKKRKNEYHPETLDAPQKTSILVILAVYVLAIVFSLLIVSAESSLTIIGTESTEKITVDAAILLELFQ